MKNIRFGGVLLLMSGWISAPASAALVTYAFSFTAADLYDYQLLDGQPGTTPAEISQFDGAGLVKYTDSDTTDGDASFTYRSWVGDGSNSDQNSNFDYFAYNGWMYGLQLSGQGNAADWGEDYKYVSATITGSPSSDWLVNDSTPIVDWYSGDQQNAPDFIYGYAGDTINASKTFSFQMTFDSDDWLWGNDTNGAPNTLGGPMTFWFSAAMVFPIYDDENDLIGTSEPYQYQGNLVLTGDLVPAPAPVPAPLWLLASGLLGWSVFPRRRLGSAC